MKYYIYLDDVVQGPYELDYIKSMNLPSDTKLCPEGSTEWIALEQIADSTNSPLSNFFQSGGFSQDQTPLKIGKYNILREIGRGGMGSVYLAVDEILNRKVAIKELKIDEHKKKDPEAYNTLLRRFKKEAQVLAQLNHKNIVSVFDIIDHNQNQYIIMEYLNGKNLEELLNAQSVFSTEIGSSIVADTCLALDYIHKKNIIHRDIKPSNIVILEDGVVKLTDFGVTRDMNSLTMTKDGSLVGTIAYASPEQDSRELDGRSDIFSLGVVLYELVTGKKPFTGDTIASVLLKIATKDPVKPSELNPKVHKMLENIILKAMSKSLSQRYPNAMDMYTDLQNYREALGSNNTALLSGVKTNENLFSSNVKVDSIPPGKIQAKDILGHSIPPGKFVAQDLAKQKSTLPPTQQNTLMNTPPPGQKPGSVTSGGFRTTIIPGTQSTPQQVENQSLRTTPVPGSSQYPQEQESLHEEILPPKTEEQIKEETEKGKSEKLQTGKSKKSKQKSHVSEQLEQERMDAIKKIALPLTFGLFLILGLLFGLFNFLGVSIILIIVLMAYYDYTTENSNQWLSYILMLVSMFIVFLWLKELIPSLENTKISPVIYYLLDFSLIMISFIGAFFILKALDFLSVHRDKIVRPIGGIIKSLLAIMSTMLIIHCTGIIEEPFVKKEFEDSKIVGQLKKALPNFKPGKKINIKVTNFGLKFE